LGLERLELLWELLQGRAGSMDRPLCLLRPLFLWPASSLKHKAVLCFGLSAHPLPRGSFCSLQGPFWHFNIHPCVPPCNHLQRSKLAQGETLLSCIREVPGSNLGRNTFYPDCGSSCYSSVPSDKAGIVPQIGSGPLPSISFPIYYSSTIVPFGAV
jgi:hypothetical protein